jgi:hypothetical protein
MRLQRIALFLAALCAVTVSASADDWETLFDGKTLDGWHGSEPNRRPVEEFIF